MVSIRNPRFHRVPSPPPLQITDRDCQILLQVFRHRFLRSTHIIALVSGSGQQVLRRSHRLFHHGYLDRPRAQIDYYRNGSEPMVYGIGQRGMKQLEESLLLPRRKVDWGAKNCTATRFFLEHSLAAADTMVAFELACRENDEIELIQYSDDVLKWNVGVRHGGNTFTLGVVPDRIFGLRSR